MKVFRFNEYINEQLTGPGNLPNFVYPDGVNYGSSGDNVIDTFGSKGEVGNRKSKLPNTLTTLIIDDNTILTSEEINDIVRRYGIYCKQNNIDPLPTDNITPELVKSMMEVL